jgi:hypothetical protein
MGGSKRRLILAVVGVSLAAFQAVGQQSSTDTKSDR